MSCFTCELASLSGVFLIEYEEVPVAGASRAEYIAGGNIAIVDQSIHFQTLLGGESGIVDPDADEFLVDVDIDPVVSAVFPNGRHVIAHRIGHRGVGHGGRVAAFRGGVELDRFRKDTQVIRDDRGFRDLFLQYDARHAQQRENANACHYDH